MEISKEEVKQLAHTVRLGLEQGEADVLTEQLNRLLQHANIMKELNTDDTPPTHILIKTEHVFRADEVLPSLPLEKVLRNAPEEEDGQIKVPSALE